MAREVPFTLANKVAESAGHVAHLLGEGCSDHSHGNPESNGNWEEVKDKDPEGRIRNSRDAQGKKVHQGSGHVKEQDAEDPAAGVI